MPSVSDDAPLLHDLMPWSVRPLRIGRGWPMAPEPGCLRARWALLTSAPDDAARAALLHPTRARGPYTPVAQLPGHRTPTTALAREDGPCPQPVRVQHGPFDQQWLIPDHRLIDVARPELWRVADEQQVFAVEQAPLPDTDEAAVTFCALLPDGRSPAGKPGRIRPLFRQPGGLDPNLAPGLTDWLAARLGTEVTAQDLLAWIAAAARPGPRGCAVPLPRSPKLWRDGLELGRRSLWLHTRGARCADPARGPGHRPAAAARRQQALRQVAPARGAAAGGAVVRPGGAEPADRFGPGVPGRARRLGADRGRGAGAGGVVRAAYGGR